MLNLQQTFFRFTKIKRPKTINLFECFAGVGTTRMALCNLYGENNIKSLGISEIKKSAITAYTDIWGADNNLGDITKIEKLPNNIDILTWSFPCQDLSCAGVGKGIIKGETRSGLGFEIPRIIRQTDIKPKILLMENVPQVAKDNQFYDIKTELSALGYSHSPLIRLTGVDVGIPQLRKRCFMVSILHNPDISNLDIEKPYIKRDELDFRNCVENSVSARYYVKLELLTTMVFTPFDQTREYRLIPKDRKICAAICESDKKQNVKVFVDSTGNARQMTEREYWRLMGIADKYFDRLKNKTDKELYGLAGDAIIVQCMELIWKNIFL